MIVSRYLSEPDSALAQGHSLITPLPEFGSESFTRLSKVRRVIRRGRVFDFLFPRPRQPFQRLDFWTAHHPLLFKLRLYQVSEPKISMWQGFTWETLRYWNELMSGKETEDSGYAGSLAAYASDLFMASDIQYLNEINAAKLVQLSAEPFSD